ncbi:hypothetical protein Golomagni_03412 [Golovinomyces magnicellulatus]|nr:hypothetical protein Golomagni_03412 [Golovinomyces magnicellulatus]
MKISQLVLALLGFLGFCAAQRSRRSSEEEIRTAITHLPQCCLNCVIPLLSSMHCSLSNLTTFRDCFCANQKIQRKISLCTASKCDVDHLTKSEELLQLICAGMPFESRQPQIYAITTITSIAVTLFVALRCHSNFQIAKKFWWDDGFLMISSIFFLAFQCLTMWGTSYGFGLHIWTANISHWHGLLLVRQNLRTLLFCFEWLWEIIYIIVQTMTKISVLLLYHRIFPQRWFRRIIIFLICIMFVHCIAFGVVIITACKPIKSFWHKEIKGRCIDVRAVGVVGAAFSIGEDVTFLLLPVPLIWKLKLKPSRKIGIILILTIGVIACAASVVRLKYLIKYNQTVDQVWENFTLVVLSQLELSLSIICVCFPAIRLLFSRSKRGNGSSDRSKTTSAPTNTDLSSPKIPDNSIMSRIRSVVSNSTSHNSKFLPWASNRAPQLSSIYITSHIELSDNDPSVSDKNTKDYETHIAATRPPENKKSFFTNSSQIAPPGILHVDKSGTIISPLQKLTDSVLRGDYKTHSRIPSDQTDEHKKPVSSS